MLSEHDARRQILRFGALCYERRLLVALDGNLSVRLNGGDILCTRAGCHKGFLTDDDLLLVDPHGKRKRGEGAPTSELAMHLACYRERRDIGAVIHAHPPLCTAFTVAGVSMAGSVLPEVVLTLGSIPTAPYRTTGTASLAESIAEYARSHDAVLMDTHGAIALGRDLMEAFCRLETMEHTAQVMKAAHDLGGINTLPEDEARRLREVGIQRHGEPGGASADAGPAGALRMIRLSDGELRPGIGEIQADLRRRREAAREPPERDMSELLVEEVLRALKER